MRYIEQHCPAQLGFGNTNTSSLTIVSQSEDVLLPPTPPPQHHQFGGESVKSPSDHHWPLQTSITGAMTTAYIQILDQWDVGLLYDNVVSDEVINAISWPACSPDQSQIRHLRDIIVASAATT